MYKGARQSPCGFDAATCRLDGGHNATVHQLIRVDAPFKRCPTTGLPAAPQGQTHVIRVSLNHVTKLSHYRACLRRERQQADRRKSDSGHGATELASSASGNGPTGSATGSGTPCGTTHVSLETLFEAEHAPAESPAADWMCQFQRCSSQPKDEDSDGDDAWSVWSQATTSASVHELAVLRHIHHSVCPPHPNIVEFRGSIPRTALGPLPSGYELPVPWLPPKEEAAFFPSRLTLPRPTMDADDTQSEGSEMSQVPVFEHLAGGPLHTYLRANASTLMSPSAPQDPAAFLIDRFAEAASALKCLHDANVAHRDVRPKNLLIRFPDTTANSEHDDACDCTRERVQVVLAEFARAEVTRTAMSHHGVQGGATPSRRTTPRCQSPAWSDRSDESDLSRLSDAFAPLPRCQGDVAIQPRSKAEYRTKRRCDVWQPSRRHTGPLDHRGFCAPELLEPHTLCQGFLRPPCGATTPLQERYADFHRFATAEDVFSLGATFYVLVTAPLGHLDEAGEVGLPFLHRRYKPRGLPGEKDRVLEYSEDGAAEAKARAGRAKGRREGNEVARTLSAVLCAHGGYPTLVFLRRTTTASLPSSGTCGSTAAIPCVFGPFGGKSSNACALAALTAQDFDAWREAQASPDPRPPSPHWRTARHRPHSPCESFSTALPAAAEDCPHAAPTTTTTRSTTSLPTLCPTSLGSPMPWAGAASVESVGADQSGHAASHSVHSPSAEDDRRSSPEEQPLEPVLELTSAQQRAEDLLKTDDMRANLQQWRLPIGFCELVDDMMAVLPEDRPTMAEVCTRLSRLA